VVSFVAFHECGFSIPAGRFIRGMLFEYGLQLQHLNPNNIQQMVAFEAMCEETPGGSPPYSPASSLPNTTPCR
jgi:hypothetical protein